MGFVLTQAQLDQIGDIIGSRIKASLTDAVFSGEALADDGILYQATHDLIYLDGEFLTISKKNNDDSYTTIARIDATGRWLDMASGEYYALKSELDPDWVSAWTLIDASTAPTTGTDFAHNLDLATPHGLRFEVWFRDDQSSPKFPSNSSRVFSWGSSTPESSASRYDGSVSIKDKDTITIAVGNDGVFSADNIFGAATSTFQKGEFCIAVWKVNGLPV